MSLMVSSKVSVRGDTPVLASVLEGLLYWPRLFWAFTESDILTFVIPNTAFGILGSFASQVLTTQNNSEHDSPSSVAAVSEKLLQRLPLVIAFNWCNVFIFDLANQRSPESVREDAVNKPWRPIPSGKLTSEATRRLMLISIPVVLLVNYGLGIWRQGVFIQILTWYQNDLRGGDEPIRDLVISVAYGLFNSASLEIAAGGGHGISISPLGISWTAIVSGVILTTMQVQDLKDKEGDRTRGRKSIPLLLGDWTSRLSILGFVGLWTVVCLSFWRLHHWTALILPSLAGLVVAIRVVRWRTPSQDASTWKWWCLWTMTLYMLPMLHDRSD